MQLIIKGTIVDSVGLNPDRCKDAAYLQSVRRLLKMKHAGLLKKHDVKDYFFVDVPSVVQC